MYVLMFVHGCVGACAHLCTCVWSPDVDVFLSYTHYYIFESISLTKPVAHSFVFDDGHQAKGSSFFHLLSSGVTDAHHHIWYFTCMLRIWLHILIFHSKHFIDWSIFPAFRLNWIINVFLSILENEDQNDGRGSRNTCCSYRGPAFIPLYPHRG